ncbi:DUF4085 family protein [Evansella tamaricis]|uniref:DUF4085 domain-containing protein n=1 Tax=Evansella tamaricis TaxID=2069301 RepID=A0ABS6JJK0_9BACI|nr:DUF4085 family protein [Evansella tamaricis]MBU9713826.1 DUF4085 domain-containing protein [Evansella tamaricis]
MWNISKEVKERFQKCNLLPIHESDEEWEIVLREAEEEGEDIQSRLKEELDEGKEELLETMPSRFIPYVENSTINQPTLPKDVREDYLNWMREADKAFEQVMEAASQQTKTATSFLPKEVQDVFEESLHDAIIERIKREDNTLHLYLNADGGFSTKAYIHLIFHNVESEKADEPVQVGQWVVYDELRKTEDGFAFRILFDCPEAEWTIAMKGMDAAYYYRPVAYTTLANEETLNETSIEEYVSQLNPDHHYWLITPHVTSAIKKLSDDEMQLEDGKVSFGKNMLVVSVGDDLFRYDLTEHNPIAFIFTDVFEDPYEEFHESVAVELLEEAALSDELFMQARAWNTMYARPEELSEIINRVLLKMEVTEENEMMISVFLNHFRESGVLTETVVEKFSELLE